MTRLDSGLRKYNQELVSLHLFPLPSVTLASASALHGRKGLPGASDPTSSQISGLTESLFWKLPSELCFSSDWVTCCSLVQLLWQKEWILVADLKSCAPSQKCCICIHGLHIMQGANFSNGSLRLQFLEKKETRYWRVKLADIHCNSPLFNPESCMQVKFFLPTENNDVPKSFCLPAPESSRELPLSIHQLFKISYFFYYSFHPQIQFKFAFVTHSQLSPSANLYSSLECVFFLNSQSVWDILAHRSHCII